MLDELRALLEERLRSMLAMLDEVAPAAFERIRATAAPGGVGLRPAAVGKDDKRA